MDQFAFFIRCCGLASIVDHKNFGKGNGLADGGGATVDFAGGQEGGAEGLGQAVHQEDPGPRQPFAQPVVHALRMQLFSLFRAIEL